MDREKMINRILARFEKGVSADPTKHMSEEDAEKWWEMNDKFKEKFKQAKVIWEWEDK